MLRTLPHTMMSWMHSHRGIWSPRSKHTDARFLLMCDAAPRALFPRVYLPWAQTGSLTFATWWEIVNFDGFVYMLRGVYSLRVLLIIRNLCAVVRLACRGESALDQPARVPLGLDIRAVRAVIAFEDITPVTQHIHKLHAIIHLVRHVDLCMSVCVCVILVCYVWHPSGGPGFS